MPELPERRPLKKVGIFKSSCTHPLYLKLYSLCLFHSFNIESREEKMENVEEMSSTSTIQV